MYQKVSTDMNFVPRELEVLDFWQKNDVFKKSVQAREGGPEYVLFDGPPTANGKPHIGHVLTRVMKDLMPRYYTMKGYHVPRKAGWDTHGLPVELEVEKLLGLDGKPQIEAYGVEPFIQKCKQSVWKYQHEWEKMSDRVGFWMDMEHPYVTYHNDYIESVWWALKQISDKGLLYKGHKVVPYCPRCGTALSSHEVAQGYKDVTETSVFVRFAVKGEENTFLLAWTTTPWTLPSNVALCVNPEETYCYAVGEDGRTYILAEALAPACLGEGAQITRRLKGRELCGLEYQPLYTWAQPEKKAHFVVADGYVTLTDGSGVVHIAPAFGEDDARVGRENDLPFVQMVNEQGCFVPEATLVAGKFVKDADADIIADLKERGLLFKAMAFTHSYPFCWRCDTPLLYYARSTWFIRMTAVRDKLLANNRSINWLPENIKEGRMGNFLENVIDWGLSRERYWGTPLPVWECACGHTHTIGSIAELKAMSPDCPDEIELHKPYIDRVHLTCPECGGLMTRVSEVIDCWFDSGSMPFAQLHYPFENKEYFEQVRYPADFISEAIDQTRGWFYTLIAISTLLFDEAAFKNCIVLGHVNDKDGLKMSKHKGNVVDPWTVLDKQGADAVRWYFYTSSAPWLPSRFYEDAVADAQRRFMGTLWNTYAFYVLYAEIDQFNPLEHTLQVDQLGQMDRYLLSRLNSLVAYVDEQLAAYHITEAARAVTDFTDMLSNWYVRLGRARYWGGEMTQDKQNAYMTLYTALVTLAKLTAPFVPFMAESMYRNLVAGLDPDAPISVHLCDYPVSDARLIDRVLEAGMDAAMNIVNLARSARATAGIKNRQPLSTLYVQGAEPLTGELKALIADEINVKTVVQVNDTRAFTTYALKPQMRSLGPRYGKLLGKIGQALAAADGNAVMDVFARGEQLRLMVEDTEVVLSQSDVLSTKTQKPGFISEGNADYTVVIDTNLTEELVREGLVRELVSKVQTMRKDAGFEVTDRIRIYLAADEALTQVAQAHERDLCGDTLAVALILGEGGESRKSWNINGHEATLGVARV